MNPEFERNFWLELTPRRLWLMLGVLGLIFFAAAVSGGEWAPSTVATWLYYVIAVGWGTRSAALSVAGEIRDRTWDNQRLSSLGAGTMMWGKLFGSTIYNWLGGAICLVLMVLNYAVHGGIATAFVELLYFLAIGVISQAAALLASLIAIGRRQSHTRFEIFVYQLAGIAAAIAVYSVWSAADPVPSIVGTNVKVDVVPWWGQKIDSRPFLLVSLAIFAGWTLIGAYREMRLELKMRNGITVWLTFLAFMGVYVAGFDAWLTPEMKNWDAGALRLLLAFFAFGGLTYLMVLLEPKDRVHYRWMEGQLRAGHTANALSGLQCWMMSYAATVVAGIVLCVWLLQDFQAALAGQPLVLAVLGFMTRDVSLFVLMQTLPGKRRGDFAALAILLGLYVLIPAILSGVGAGALLFVFVPQTGGPLWLGAIAAWIQGGAVAAAAIGRLALTDRQAPAAAKAASAAP